MEAGSRQESVVLIEDSREFRFNSLHPACLVNRPGFAGYYADHIRRHTADDDPVSAVFTGMALHVIVHVYDSAERTRLIQIVPQEDGGLGESTPPSQLNGHEITILQPVGRLYFARAAELEQLLLEVGNAKHAVVILRLWVYDEVSTTFLRLVENFAAKLAANSGRLILVGIEARVIDQLEKTGLADCIGCENIFLSSRASGML